MVRTINQELLGPSTDSLLTVPERAARRRGLISAGYGMGLAF